jgi:multiple antibiotic resistance protein
MSLLTLTTVLFLIMDPLGQLKSFGKCLEGINPKRQKHILFRELLIALGVILLFWFIGEFIFSVLQISNIAVYLSSGIILFLSSIKILFPSRDAGSIQCPKGEPFLVPLAIPMIAGPALLATVMLYADTVEDTRIMFFAILIAWSLTAIIHLYSRQIVRCLGSSGLMACEKLMGMVLVLLSVQRFFEGILLIGKS